MDGKSIDGGVGGVDNGANGSYDSNNSVDDKKTSSKFRGKSVSEAPVKPYTKPKTNSSSPSNTIHSHTVSVTEEQQENKVSNKKKSSRSYDNIYGELTTDGSEKIPKDELRNNKAALDHFLKKPIEPSRVEMDDDSDDDIQISDTTSYDSIDSRHDNQSKRDGINRAGMSSEDEEEGPTFTVLGDDEDNLQREDTKYKNVDSPYKIMAEPSSSGLEEMSNKPEAEASIYNENGISEQQMRLARESLALLAKRKAGVPEELSPSRIEPMEVDDEDDDEDIEVVDNTDAMMTELYGKQHYPVRRANELDEEDEEVNIYGDTGTLNEKQNFPVNRENEIDDEVNKAGDTRTLNEKQFLSEKRANKRVDKMLASCEKGSCHIINYINTENSALLIWDPKKNIPVYTTFNKDGKQVDSDPQLNSLRKDMRELSDSRFKNNVTRIRGLNTNAVLEKIEKSHLAPFDAKKNNSAKYIADLLKASFPDEEFAHHSREQMSHDTNKLALEVKEYVRSKKK